MLKFDRIKRGTAATISNSWKSGSTVLDPGVVTIGIVAADGTVVVTSGTPTSGSGAAARTFNLTTTHTAALDTLTATWTSSTQGAEPTIHEIVGDYLCDLDDLRAIFTDTTGYPDSRLREIRTEAEQRLEKALGYACVPRYALEPRPARRYGEISTQRPLRAVRSVSVGGTAYSAGQIATLQLTRTGIWGLWPSWGSGLVVIGYEHGEDRPDADITRALLLLAGEVYGADAADGNVVRREADNMAVTYASPSARGPFVGSELNSIIRANALPAIA